ncbi:MAG: T9SS type A sorting domain-containing protein [Flavobacteriaceae bacterium]
MIKKILFFILLMCTVLGYSQKKISKLTASPNPFVNSTNVTFNSDSKQEITFTVRNVIGKTVLVKKINAKKGKNSIIFFKNNLKAGMYLYSIRYESKVASKRFVIR